MPLARCHPERSKGSASPRDRAHTPVARCHLERSKGSASPRDRRTRHLQSVILGEAKDLLYPGTGRTRQLQGVILSEVKDLLHPPAPSPNPNKHTARFSHPTFPASTNAIFRARTHPFNSFSRAIAAPASACASHHTNREHLYRAAKPAPSPARCANTRCRRSPVTPTYNTRLLLAMMYT